MNSIRSLLFLASIGFLTGAIAEPSPPIRQLMAVPPSAFDVFLFRLHESAKCGNWLGAAEPPDLCLASVQYTPATDVLDLHFQMSPVHEDLMDFAELGEEQREFRLLGRLERLTQLAGVEGRWGLLWSVPLSVAGDVGIDRGAAREALASRSAVHLHVTYGTTVYTATRDVDGFTEVLVTNTEAGAQ